MTNLADALYNIRLLDDLEKKNTLRNNRDQMRFNYIINHDCNVIIGSKPSKR